MSQLWFGFTPWPKNFYAMGAAIKKKKKIWDNLNIKTNKKNSKRCNLFNEIEIHESINECMSKKRNYWNACCGAAEMNPTRKHEVMGLTPGIAQWVKDLALP